MGRAAADAYRTLRQVQHRARLNEEPTRVPPETLAAERDAILALWRAVFGQDTPERRARSDLLHKRYGHFSFQTDRPLGRAWCNPPP
ncbi:glutamate-ammonia-ligase adenylyltransferase [Alicycliphilus sp. B1]|nr:glutamate-ammonia-ligase adenylyltransferase [Alicycliphilus sp. B1]